MLSLTFLAAILVLMLGAFIMHLASRRGTSDRVRQLATACRMQYVEHDLFQITPRVVERFPIPGASDLRVADVVYRQDGDRYRYIFTVQFTLGVVRTKERVSRVATFCEPRDRACPTDWSNLVLAPTNLSLMDQYSHLCQPKT